VYSQDTDEPAEKPPAKPATKEDKRLFGIFPNYKTMPADTGPIKPLTVGGKFKLAAKDSFDPPVFLTSAFYAGIAHLSDQYPTWRQGARGYGKRYGSGYADQAIGNFLVEASLPALFHQDPRFFRLGKGGFAKRTGYALSRIWVTRTDSGGTTFNISEFGGNGLAALVGNLYYPGEGRAPENTLNRWATQLVGDSVFNVLKEFYPDIRRKLFKH